MVNDMANYYYNEIELPELPEWDKETYPYACICLMSSGTYWVYLSDIKLRINFAGSHEWLGGTAGTRYLYYKAEKPDFNSWIFGSEDTISSSGNLGYVIYSTPIWSNYEVIKYDGSIYLAASEPVPVGGEPEQPENRTEWKKQYAYKPNTEWNGKTFYRVMGGKWVKQDVVVPQVVEVEPDVPDPDVPEPDVPDPEKPTSWLTFSSAEPFTIGVANAKKNWDGTLYYSTDTTTWSEWDGTVAIASAEHDGEQRVYMSGSGNSIITGNAATYTWVLTGSNISCNGNIENLLDYEIVANGEHPVMAEACYYAMFYGCTSLTQAPELPATTLTDSCYTSMFADCTSLTQAPKLPATTLAANCYRAMFANCTSLAQAPELPATTLAANCYRAMFQNCAELASAPALPATSLAVDCYTAMFRECTSLTQAPELPATTLAANCYYYMFYGCTSLSQATKLPATSLAEYCYFYMFYGCTSLMQATKLPATSLASFCYYNMFYGCTKIKLSKTQSDECPYEYRIPTSGTGTTATSALGYMFKNTGGTFTGTPSINTTYYTANEVV